MLIHSNDQFVHHKELGLEEIRSQELHPGLPHGWQAGDPSHGATSAAFTGGSMVASVTLSKGCLLSKQQLSPLVPQLYLSQV